MSDELKNFEDFEDEQSTLVLDSTDEIKVAGFAKEAASKGKPAWWIEEKVREEKPHLTWIIPKVLGVETTAVNHTKYVVSKPLTTKETSSSTKKVLYGSLALSLLFLTVIFLIDTRRHLTNHSKRRSPTTNTESKSSKKTTTTLKKEPVTLKSVSEVKSEPKPKKKAFVVESEEEHEPTLFESIMEEVE